MFVQYKKTDSIVVAPPSSEKTKGTVVLVSEDVENIKVGDLVFFQEHDMISLEHTGEKYKAIKESDIIAYER